MRVAQGCTFAKVALHVRKTSGRGCTRLHIHEKYWCCTRTSPRHPPDVNTLASTWLFGDVVQTSGRRHIWRLLIYGVLVWIWFQFSRIYSWVTLIYVKKLSILADMIFYRNNYLIYNSIIFKITFLIES